jgi:hypothetical protein
MSTTTQSITPSQNTVSYSTWNSDLQNQTFAFKNRIINGDMVIDQRNNGAAVTLVSGSYSLDRWNLLTSQASKYSFQRNAGSVTPPAGFTNYLGITSTSAYSVLSTDFFAVLQSIEGFNFADLGFGTANAQTITVSFWVRSSLTGTFGGAFNGYTGSRAYPFSYTISAANTWERKTITIPGDTSGTWVGASNAGAAYLLFSLGAGSDRSGTAGAWVTPAVTTPFSTTGAVSVVGTNGATFYITGVQLEKGTTATNFDVLPYGTELALCQRYFEILNAGLVAVSRTSGTNIVYGGRFQVLKRASPTMTFNNSVGANIRFLFPSVAFATVSSIEAVNGLSESGVHIESPSSNTFDSTRTGLSDNVNGGRIFASAEL